MAEATGSSTPSTETTDSTKGATTTTAPAATEVDLTKLSGDQLNKVLENPELWKTPRMQELLADSKKAKDLEKSKAEADEKSLTEQKKFEELANKRGEENSSLKSQIQAMKIDQALSSKLIPLGVVDLDGALKLVDRSKLKVDDAGAIEGLDTAIEALKTDKAYLFNSSGTTNQPRTVGTPTNQGDTTTGVMRFKRSQLQDPAFYKANREEILKANAAGLIENDIQ